jgi:hypothetical protein
MLSSSLRAQQTKNLSFLHSACSYNEGNRLFRNIEHHSPKTPCYIPKYIILVLFPLQLDTETQRVDTCCDFVSYFNTLNAMLNPKCHVLALLGKSKGKAVPLQAWAGPDGSRKLRFPDFMTTAQDGVRLSTLRTGRLYP